MKRTSIYYFSLAAILAGSLASCQDENQGVDYETVRASVYNRQFVQRFGEPAANHNWGFGLAEYFMGLGSGSAETRAAGDNPYEFTGDQRVWKMQATRTIDGVNLFAEDVFGRVPDITPEEYKEVYAWFSTHKVEWPDGTTPKSYDETNGVTRPAIVTAYPVFEGEAVETELDKIMLKDNKAVNYDSDPNYRKALGSLTDPEHDSNVIDDPLASVAPPFFNGWIQVVAARQETGPHMDYITFRSLSNTTNGYVSLTNSDAWVHALDYNTKDGYGYYRQSTTMNAELIMGTSFGVVTYQCSNDNISTKYHDKYFIVKLEGDGYSGYYLGLDYECCRDDGKSVPADGFCNDLIIKIGDAGQTPYNPSRIMCEDLGTNDFDFNDLVYDVEYRNNIATITVQAVGGTIPICICYGKYDNETAILANALRPKGETSGELHSIFKVDTDVPVNVLTVTKNPIQIKVAFKNTQSDRISGCDVDLTSKTFDLSSLQIYVQHTDEAEWLNVENYNQMGGAPQKFCVPNSVKWTKENKHIENAYSKFPDWVSNPLKFKFWGMGDEYINSSLLW